MDKVTRFPPGSEEEHNLFLNVIHDSLSVRRHFDLLCWLQGDLQNFLPHEILLAAWGDFASGVIFIDVISKLPGIRTGPVIDSDITPFLQGLYRCWKDNGCAPLHKTAEEGFSPYTAGDHDAVARAFSSMHSAIAHGIRDERGQHECLYSLFSSVREIPASAPRYLEVLLPHIDMALRQVLHLPEQRSNNDNQDPLETIDLSEREMEIMRWVRAGKTNQEIGLILDISAFTVKNHLQRIFRKLDVSNRAQAVDKVSKTRVRD